MNFEWRSGLTLGSSLLCFGAAYLALTAPPGISDRLLVATGLLMCGVALLVVTMLVGDKEE